jgi:hypothetical protein
MSKPKLYLGPWTRIVDVYSCQYGLPILGARSCYNIIYNSIHDNWHHPNSPLRFSSCKEAMQDVERFLDKRYEAVFLTQEQFDRLSLLA